MTERPAAVPLDPRVRLVGHLVATLSLGLLSGAIAQNILGEPLAALGAGMGAAVMAFLAWSPLVLGRRGVAIYGAAVVGLLTLLGGYVGMAVVGGGASKVIADPETAVALLFSFFIVAPMIVSLAVAVAFAMRWWSLRGEDASDA
ncbi:MAG: hypothetical protein ABTQ29_04595 [Siculibacillus sp.]